MDNNFEDRVVAARDEYRKTRYVRPKYLIINGSTLFEIKNRVSIKKSFGLVNKKIYKGLYIAIDNELEDYEFVIAG